MSIVEGDIVVWRERGYHDLESVGTVERLTPYDNLYDWAYVKGLKDGKSKRILTAYLRLATPTQIVDFKIARKKAREKYESIK